MLARSWVWWGGGGNAEFTDSGSNAGRELGPGGVGWGGGGGAELADSADDSVLGWSLGKLFVLGAGVQAVQGNLFPSLTTS